MTSDAASLRMMDRAFTRPEVESVEAALRQYLAIYPEAHKRDPWHGWHNTLSYLQEREETARQLGLSNAQFQEREAVLRQSFVSPDPFTDQQAIQKVQTALLQLVRWLERFPVDPLAQERLETLKREATYVQEMIAANLLAETAGIR